VYPWPENSRIAKKTSGPSLGGAGWGKLLDWAKQQLASIVPAFNVTNAVKHFKFEERGNRRIHKKPSTSQVKACRPWRCGNPVGWAESYRRFLGYISSVGGPPCARSSLEKKKPDSTSGVIKSTIRRE
jgi:hypothetical protein